MKGFKDSDGKFRPISTSKGIRKKSDKTRETTGIKMSTGIRKKKDSKNDDGSQFKQIKVWEYDDAPKELQQKILDNWRNTYSAQENFFAEDEGILHDTRKPNLAFFEIFENTIPKFWNIDRGGWIQFGLDLKEPTKASTQKLAKYLGINENLRRKIQFDFENDDQRSTKLLFRDVMGNTVDLEESLNNPELGADQNFWLVEKEDKPTEKEYQTMIQASEKWNELIEMSLKHLRGNYDSEFEDETIIENIRANEHTFNESGEIERL